MNKKAFTFIELIIVITILSILSTIWVLYYFEYISTWRDTTRTQDIRIIQAWLDTYFSHRLTYPYPKDYFNITYSWSIVAYQWIVKSLAIWTKTPVDPKTNWYYSFSITKDREEYEIAWTLENSNENISIILWNYRSVSKNILPTIILAKKAIIWENIEIKDSYLNWSENRNLFTYDGQDHNLVYNFTAPYNPFSDWTDFNTLLEESSNKWKFEQNSDFRSCQEIEEWWKLLLELSSNPIEYQIVSNTWSLTNTWCTN